MLRVTKAILHVFDFMELNTFSIYLDVEDRQTKSYVQRRQVKLRQTQSLDMELFTCNSAGVLGVCLRETFVEFFT